MRTVSLPDEAWDAILRVLQHHIEDQHHRLHILTTDDKVRVAFLDEIIRLPETQRMMAEDDMSELEARKLMCERILSGVAGNMYLKTNERPLVDILAEIQIQLDR